MSEGDTVDRRQTTMTRDQALSIVHDCYTTGQPSTLAASLTGRSAAWAATEYRKLKTRGVCPVAGQLELFEIG